MSILSVAVPHLGDDLYHDGCPVDFSSISHVADEPEGLLITLAVNLLVKPFTMAGPGFVFFQISVCRNDVRDGCKFLYRSSASSIVIEGFLRYRATPAALRAFVLPPPFSSDFRRYTISLRSTTMIFEPATELMQIFDHADTVTQRCYVVKFVVKSVVKSGDSA